MIRVILLLLAVLCFVLAAFSVATPTVNGGHPFGWFYLGLAFWALSTAGLDSYRRGGPARE